MGSTTTQTPANSLGVANAEGFTFSDSSNVDSNRVSPASVGVSDSTTAGTQSNALVADPSSTPTKADADSCIQAAGVASEAAFNTYGSDISRIASEAEKTLQNSSCKDNKPSSEVLHALAIVASKRDPKDRLTDIRRSSFVTKEFIADVVYDRKRDRLRFAVWDKSTGKISLEPFLTRADGVRILPPADPHRNVGKNVVLLPSKPQPYGSQEQLVAEIKQVIHKFCDIPDFWEDLIAHYVLMTWLFDRFGSVPYLRFLGEPDTGKTRTLWVARALSYKSILVGGATSTAPVFRLIETWGGTFVVDESDFKNSDEHADIIKIFNQGYMPGFPVVRSDGKDHEARAFDVWGPKILSTRNPFEDSATETRCLTLETTERESLRDDIPLNLPFDLAEQLLPLRNKLLQWRLDNFWKIDPDESEMRRVSRRLGQIGTSLYTISEDETFRAGLLDFLGSQGKKEKARSHKAGVVEAFGLLVEESKDQLSAGPTQPTQSVLRLPVKAIVEKTNELGLKWGQVAQGENWISPRKVGGILKSLRFDGKRDKTGWSYAIERDRLKALRSRYGAEE